MRRHWTILTWPKKGQRWPLPTTVYPLQSFLRSMWELASFNFGRRRTTAQPWIYVCKISFGSRHGRRRRWNWGSHPAIRRASNKKSGTSEEGEEVCVVVLGSTYYILEDLKGKGLLDPEIVPGELEHAGESGREQSKFLQALHWSALCIFSCVLLLPTKMLSYYKRLS